MQGGLQFVLIGEGGGYQAMSILDTLTEADIDRVFVCLEGVHETLNDACGALKLLRVAVIHDNYPELIQDIENDWLRICGVLNTLRCRKFDAECLPPPAHKTQALRDGLIF